MTQENPLRVLVILSNRNPSWAEACNLPEWLIPLAVQLLKENGIHDTRGDTPPDTRLLAIQRWNVRVLFTFDISNRDYDVNLGHEIGEKQNNLPVVVVHLSSLTK